MKTFESLPKQIKAIEYGKDELPGGVEVKDGHVWNKKQASWIKINSGDFLRVDLAPDDVYPIGADYMANNFKEV